MTQIAFAALLALAMLSSQWAGLRHRISHPGLPPASGLLASYGTSVDADNGKHLFHSCLLFDAAALGVTLYTPFFTGPCAKPPSVPVHRQLERSWQARFIPHFSPRAPPSFN